MTTTSPRNGGGRSKAPHKWLLAACWIFALVRIWLAPDGDGSDESVDHPSFGEPEREKRSAVAQALFGDVVPEEETGAIDFIQGVGGEVRWATNSSLDGDKKSLETDAKEALERTQQSYLAEATKYLPDAVTIDRSGDIPDEAGSNAAADNESDKSKATEVLSQDEGAKDKTTETILSDDTDPDAPINKTKAHGTETLLEALQPIIFKECCIPASLSATNHQKDVACFGTCYNERACDDPIYPFKSAEERVMFPLNKLSAGNKKRLRFQCKSPERLSPPAEWCQTPHVEERNDTSASAQLVRGIPPAGCSQVTNGGGSGPFQHVIIFPAAKLAFCGIPKVGITQWEQFLRFVNGAKDYPALPHYKVDRSFFQFDALDPNAQRRIWNDEGWTWAAFLRDPAERLLSAFLDKVKSKKGRFKWMDRELTFEQFVDSLGGPFNATHCQNVGGGSITGLNWCSDPHWRPQVYSCGISERLDRFQFVGDIHNSADQTRELLGHVGLWESHGRHFINGGVQAGRSPWCNIMSHPYNHTLHVGFQQKDEVSNSSAAETVYGHSKGSKGRMEEFYTPELLKRVREELYADDYNLWKLVNANGIKMSKGRELASRLSKKCSSYVLTRPLP